MGRVRFSLIVPAPVKQISLAFGRLLRISAVQSQTVAAAPLPFPESVS